MMAGGSQWEFCKCVLLYNEGNDDDDDNDDDENDQYDDGHFVLQPDGLILYNGGKDNDFIAIELIQGHLHYTYNMGWFSFSGGFFLSSCQEHKIVNNYWPFSKPPFLSITYHQSLFAS